MNRISNIWPFNKNLNSSTFIVTCIVWYIGLVIMSSLALARIISVDNDWIFFYVIGIIPGFIFFAIIHVKDKIQRKLKMSNFHLVVVSIFIIWYIALIAISAMYTFHSYPHPQLIFQWTMIVIYIAATSALLIFSFRKQI